MRLRFLVTLLTLTVLSFGHRLAAEVVENQVFRLAVSRTNGGLAVTLDEKLIPLRLSEGNYIYRALVAGNDQPFSALQDPVLTADSSTLTIRGKLAGLEVEQTFSFPPGKPWMEERIALRNPSPNQLSLAEFEMGFALRLLDSDGKVRADLASDRVVAVPFRHRPDDANGVVHDFALANLLQEKGWEYSPGFLLPGPRRAGSRHHFSEGWAWTHGRRSLGLFSFNQEHLVFSVLSPVETPKGDVLRFGGFCYLPIQTQPSALTRIAPGRKVDLGIMRYQSIDGGYIQAAYAYRKMLDEQGCRFPAGFNPPVHWEQLYDMRGAWNNRIENYTKACVEREAAKGVQYSCEALYLDPGWDTTFGSFLWGDKWLGPRKAFIDEIQSKYGLKVSLHTPLPPWTTTSGREMGPTCVSDWPAESLRTPPAALAKEQVPAVRDGRRNLALLPKAKARASSSLRGYSIHRIEHANDGGYGNDASWICAHNTGWVEIDLGAVYRIGSIWLSNDNTATLSDRAITSMRVLVATKYDADSDAATWNKVAESTEPLSTLRKFAFPPVEARWVRVDILATQKREPRIDEIEIYEADKVSAADAEAHAKIARIAKTGGGGPAICMGSRAFLDEAEKRLLANCADGVVFLMYDGTGWNGPCLDARHGHPVPYLQEDHFRDCIDLCRRVHARYPNVLIELHDMLAGGGRQRMTPVYYKYGLPGSYDENWGFELMWRPMDDLRQGRGLGMYYYNLACNVPIYLHIDLRSDNENCVALWWFASTARHLGIGGTHADPKVAAAQKEAMKYYRRFEQFFKRGEFYGLGEEIHIHVLPEQKAFVVNLFNLSDQPKKVAGSTTLRQLGLDPQAACKGSQSWGEVDNGVLKLEADMPPWSAKVADFRAQGIGL
jgi:hypothetical protein